MVAAVVAVIAIVGTVTLSACSPAPGLIDSTELTRLQSDGALIVDVRTASEFTGGHIPGAENVSMSALEDTAGGWDTTVPVVVYCATGSRSADAAETLRSMGFSAVYDLSGGIMQWDGELEGGVQSSLEGTASPAPGTPSTSGLPVVYEFYTDW